MKNEHKITSKDVVTVRGIVWNHNTRTIGNAMNYNAQILKNALDRIAELEKQLADMAGGQKNEQIHRR